MLQFFSDSACLLAAEGSSGWLMFAAFLFLVALFVGPFFVGELLGRMLKLKDVGFRIGVVLFATVMAVTMFLWPVAIGQFETWRYASAVEAYPEAKAEYEKALAEWEKTGKSQGLPEPQKPEPPEQPTERSWQDSIRLGIDLAGGTNLVFQAYSDDPNKPITNEVMDQMVAKVSRRINPSGTEEITVRRVGADRIEVIIPGADREDVESIKRRIHDLGSLEFAILANQQDHPTEIAQARELPDSETDLRVGGRVRAAWLPVGVDAEGNPKDVSTHGEVAWRDVERDGKTVREFLVVFEPENQRIRGERYLTRAYRTTDENGAPAVGFIFNTQGGFRFQQLTSRYRPRATDDFTRRLAVLLNNEVHSAPNLRETISTSGQISGRFTPQEIDELISVLNSGALVVPIHEDPISEFSISPLLGHDVQEKGKRAILLSGAAVLLFMFVYYRFAGAVANLCLVLNLVLILGMMAFIDATFTLPGLAGLVLTIGMAVDANVLIFERIREETARGSSLRMAIQNGFAKAFSTIVDANVTTLITAVVLYIIGTDQVRGFAVTLFIGIVMSMFTALYFGRLVFDVFERKRWIKQLNMMSLVGATKWDFVGKKGIAVVCSAVLLVAGLGALGVRGEDNLDIDFSGGTMVAFELAELPEGKAPTIDEVRKILTERPELGTAVTLERLVTLEELEQGVETSNRYRLRTKVQDVEMVQHTINESLGAAGYPLRLVTMKPFEITPIPTTGATSSDVNAGGHRVDLAFSDGVKTTTIRASVAAALEGLTGPDGVAKYEDAAELLEVTGTSVDPDNPNAYTEMLLNVQPVIAQADLQTALKQVQDEMEENPIFDEVNTFASSVASEMKQSAVMAMLVSMLAIVAYLWFRFARVTFGLAAIAAVVHDVFVVLGMVALASFLFGTPVGPLLALEDFKINLPMIAAFLTIVGYSLNDTIVVFDRIREIRGKNPALTDEMVNRSLNQTLSRTLLTSLTTLIVVIILYASGGEGIHGFAYCLVVGVIVGTYSTIYVASPILVWLMNRPGGATERAATPTRTATTTTAAT